MTDYNMTPEEEALIPNWVTISAISMAGRMKQ